MSIHVPESLAALHARPGDQAGRAWVVSLPALAADSLDRWALRPDGPPAHGMASLVLPVVRADGTPAALKLYRVNEETADAPAGLRTWDGDGIVRLLDDEPESGAMLLERLDASRPLTSLPDDDAAMEVLAGLLARLVAVPAPEGVRRLSDIAAAMLDQVPGAVPALRDPDERQLVRTCAATVAELAGEAGDRLLHWDLHYENVLAGEREPWLAIDPQPLAGDPGFDLLPSVGEGWEKLAAAGDPSATVLRRFDRLTEALGLERDRAVGWTLGRVLENALWDIEDGATALDPGQVAIAALLRERRPPRP
ncbi:aminoglycoside phosphotransferase family protein [Spirillospora sp. CA-294931]|uniref:aminoglycoside phosphotransferase family protein n=1 Tax=Spirillospora sp. CA-294931 TaxID=3240042 RepID=UPI003D9380A7